LSGDPANGTTTFGYDALSRLVVYTPPSSISSQSYAYNSEPDRASITTGTAVPLTSYRATFATSICGISPGNRSWILR